MRFAVAATGAVLITYGPNLSVDSVYIGSHFHPQIMMVASAERPVIVCLANCSQVLGELCTTSTVLYGTAGRVIRLTFTGQLVTSMQ